MALRITRLTCENQTTALGIGTTRPRFGWRLDAGTAGGVQTAYQIRILDRTGGTLFDTGKVPGHEQVGVVCDLSGIIVPFGLYRYEVRVWNGRGTPSDWAGEDLLFGVFKACQWPGDWFDTRQGGFGPVGYYRTRVSIGKQITKAFFYLASLGEKAPASFAYLNGHLVGDLVNFPGASELFHALYTCVDVTEILHTGDNVLAMMTLKKCSCVLRVFFEDGSDMTLRADKRTWRYRLEGPYTRIGYAETREHGRLEHYDARSPGHRWYTVDFDDSDWPFRFDPKEEAWPISWAPLLITPQYCCAHTFQTNRPMLIVQHPDRWFIDFGRNMSGQAGFRLKGKRGQTIVLHYAENLDEETGRNVYTPGYTRYDAECAYTFAGDGVEEYRPHFMMIGFRCLEVTGYDGPITMNDFTAWFIHSDVENASFFSCSDDVLCQLHYIARRSFLCNLVNIPTDCPERERRGWTADAWAVCEAECVNFDMLTFYSQWFESMRDCQRGNGWIPVELPISTDTSLDVDWPMACVFIPHDVWMQTGDRVFLARQYDMMTRYAGLMEELCDEQYRIADCHLSYKDWLAYEPASSAFIGMAYFFRLIDQLSDIAGILGHAEDAARYADLAGRILTSLNTKFLHEENGRAWYDNGTQSANAHALFFHICPPDLRPAVTESLVSNIHEKGANTTGFMGIMCLLACLSENGRSDIAYGLLQNRKKGGWRYLIEQCHATTFPESFHGYGSQNHAFLGSAPGLWLTKFLVGISPAEPGYRKVAIAPFVPDDLEYARAKVETPYGIISSEWRKKGDRLKLSATLPVGTTATVRYRTETAELTSGRHTLSFQMPQICHRNECLEIPLSKV